MSMPPPMVLYVSDAPLGFGKNTPLGIKVTKGICCPLAAAKAISKAASRKTAAKALRQYRRLSADPLLPTRDKTWRNMPIETTNQWVLLDWGWATATSCFLNNPRHRDGRLRSVSRFSRNWQTRVATEWNRYSLGSYLLLSMYSEMAVNTRKGRRGFGTAALGM